MAPKKAQASASTESVLLRPKRSAVTKSTSTTAANIAKKRKDGESQTPAKSKAPTKAQPKKTATKAATKKTTTASAAKSSTKKSAATAPNTSKKRAAEKKSTTATKDASKKRKAEDDDEKPAKKTKTTVPKEAAPKVLKKGPVINDAPKERLEILVFGEGSAGELGLGTAKNAVDVKRPRVNAKLNPDQDGVVQISAGGMHVAALTSTNKILTWGVNDTSALARNTEWEGGLVDAGAEADSDSDEDDDSGLNPHEATPAEIDLSTTELAKDTRWTKVAAGDTCTFALTDDGKVYGWGTFRCNEGPFGFTPTIDTATRPILIEGLKDIVDIACGATHALALDNKGTVFAWGSGEQNQLGRKVVDRNKRQGLYPREVGMPRTAKRKIKKIASGPYHSFAITNDDEVYAWGLNAFGQTGVSTTSTGESGAIIPTAQHVESLAGKRVVSIAGGSHHSIVATANGECLTWGRVDAGQLGFSRADLETFGDSVLRNESGQLALLTVPTKTPQVEGHAVTVSAGPEHSIVVTKEGKAYSTGFSANYQTGLGTDDDVHQMTLIDNTAVKERILNGVAAGGQFSILTAQLKA